MKATPQRRMDFNWEVKRLVSNNGYRINEAMRIAAERTLEERKGGKNKIEASSELKKLIEERDKAKEWEEEKRLNSKIRTQARKDRKKRVLDELDKDLDVRDQWLGLKRMKSTHVPRSFCRKDQHGKHIPMNMRAEEAASYLEGKQWGVQADKTAGIRRDKITYKDWQMRIDPPDRVEVDMAIHKLKRDKAEGTDETSINQYKDLSSENRKEIVKLLGEWWNNEYIPDDDLLARVVLIFKKGDPAKLENYRPISLLNVLYKIMAIVLQKRISEKLDGYIHNMQFGFRKKRSTADAIAFLAGWTCSQREKILS